MHVFVTGATGFIGSRVVKELLDHGHTVTGLTRSEKGAAQLKAVGANAALGTLEDAEGIARALRESGADAVIHTAFDHDDFSRFVEHCEKDRRVILALGSVLEGTQKPLIITSGTGMGTREPGQPAVEDFYSEQNPNPRVLSEKTAHELRAKGINVSSMRLPQVHDTEKQGFVTYFILAARQHGVVGYAGEGKNRWPAGHVLDVARLYRLAVEKEAEKGRHGTGGGQVTNYHAATEQGVAQRDIAEVVAAGLGLPLKSLTPDEAKAHFGWMAGFVQMDSPASSDWTRRELGWNPTGPDLLTDLKHMDYSKG